MRNSGTTRRVRRPASSAKRARGRLPARTADRQAQTPEWATESWKHRVEAEARTRLKHELIGGRPTGNP